MYRPENPPQDPAMLPGFLLAEFQKIERAFTDAMAKLTLVKLYAAPVKPREGDVVLADGTTWNPGAGGGVYRYDGAAWQKLG